MPYSMCCTTNWYLRTFVPKLLSDMKIRGGDMSPDPKPTGLNGKTPTDFTGLWITVLAISFKDRETRGRKDK